MALLVLLFCSVSVALSLWSLPFFLFRSSFLLLLSLLPSRRRVVVVAVVLVFVDY